MANLNFFWKRSEGFLWVLIVISFMVPLLLQKKLSDFHFSIIILPLLFKYIKFFYLKYKLINERQFIIYLFLSAVILRFISVFLMAEILSTYNGMPFLSYKDDFIYNESSFEILGRWRAQGIGFYDDVRYSKGFYSGFPNLSAILMYLFGDSFYVPRLGNCFFSAWTVILVYKICKLYSSDSAARLVSILFAFSPLLIVYSSLQLKDTILLFLTFLSIYYILLLLTGSKSILTVIKLAFVLFIMVFFRAATIVPLMGGYLFVYLYQLIAVRKKIRFSKFSLVLMCFVAYLFITQWNYISSMEVVASSDVYFNGRYGMLSNSDIENTSANISKTDLAKYMGAPLFILGAPFLPPFIMIILDDSSTINYTLTGLILHFAVLPFLIFSFFIALRKIKSNIYTSYIVVTLILFKVGQASAFTSIFNPRQSLAGIFILYLLLPLYFEKEQLSRWIKIVSIIIILILIVYNYVRLFTRGLL